jgi:DNA helicase HerA-like ATPase
MDRITHFARTNARNDRRVFGIKRSDRLSHMYIIGKTGTGKSTLLERLILSDIEAGEGLVLVDPHGDLVERIVARVPEHRKSDVIFLDVPRPGQPYGYNPLKRVAPEKRPLAASGLLEVFEKMWPEAWGVRMEHIFRNALLALLDQPQATLPDILRLFSDKAFRRRSSGTYKIRRCVSSGSMSMKNIQTGCARTRSRRSKTRLVPFSPTQLSIES